MNGPPTRIVVADIRIPFIRLVLFFVKCALAAIPAAIILFLLGMLLTAVLAALLGGGHMDFLMRKWTL
jgi:hypothetical protein